MNDALFSMLLNNCHVKIHYKKGLLSACEQLKREGYHFSGRKFSIDLVKQKNLYTPVLRWSANSPRRLLKIEFVFDGDIKGRWSWYKHGYQSWTATRSYRPGEVPLAAKRPWYLPIVNPVAVIQDNMNNLPSGEPFEFNSESFVILKNLDTGTCEFAGVNGDFKDFVYFRSRIQADKITRLVITYDYDNFQISENDKERIMEPLLIDRGNEEEILENYFDGIKKRKSISTAKKIPVGWCSWYYYFHNIRISDVLSNLKVCKERKLNLDYFQIDDGWQRKVGDWLEMKPEYENRMKYLADEIHNAGYQAGIWMAPFSAMMNSNVFRKHPDWFIRDYTSVLTRFRAYAGFIPQWGGFYLGLDITHPDAEEYVRKVIRTAVKEWGYEVLKLDFLYSAALSGQCHDNTLTRAERMIKGMNIIREEAGPDTFILGCGIPIMQGIGIVNGNRISGDVAPFWIGKDEIQWGGESHVGTRNAMRNTLNRSVMHKRLWLNDPDCLMIRDTDTELTDNEIKMLKDIICVSNGMLIISDDMEKLPDRKILEIREAFKLSSQLNRGKVYTLGIMNASHPNYLLNTAGILLALNFSDKESSVSLDRAQLERIFRKTGKKVPSKFVSERRAGLSIRDLEKGISLSARSSMMLKFR